jgi:membrane-bound lytic murein transglycosylase D
MSATPGDMAKGVKSTRNSEDKIKINGVTAIKALPGDKAGTIAERGSVDLSYFLKCNDISISDVIIPGQYYFVGKKRMRASESYHKVSPEDNLWKISQQYGVQIKKLRKYNRLESNRDIQQGMTLWLSATKPKSDRRSSAPDEVVEIDTGETFAWAVASTEVAKHPVTKPKEPKDDVVTVNTEISTEAPIQKIDSSSVTVSSSPPVVEKESSPEVKKIEVRPEKHIVQAGETLYAISQKYNVGVMDLVTWNNLDLKAGIKPGQELKLIGAPADIEDAEPEAKVSSNEIIHEVKASDTLYSVARKYGVTINDLM